MAENTVVPLQLRRSEDGHVLEGLCVPYGVTTMKAGYPRGERFVPGAFAGVTSAGAKVRLTDSHARDGRRPVGVATELREADDGLYGLFRFYDTPEGRGAWENVVEDTYGGLSIGYVPLDERRGSDGAREVTAAQLFHVSLVDEPAYAEAKVLAVRSARPDVEALLAVSYNLEDFPEPVDFATLVFSRTATR